MPKDKDKLVTSNDCVHKGKDVIRDGGGDRSVDPDRSMCPGPHGRDQNHTQNHKPAATSMNLTKTRKERERPSTSGD